jgi:photosystem II stability/assembly factor-like uncharacterized protein
MTAPRITVFPLLLAAVALLTAGAPSAAATRVTRIGPYGGSVNAVVAAPSRPNLVYAGLQVGGVFRSADAGRSWTFAGAGLIDVQVFDLAVHPRLPATVYAATSRGLFKSGNGGAAWTRLAGVPTGLAGEAVFTVVVDPRSPRNVYAALFAGPFVKSTDGGATWRSDPAWPRRVETLAVDPGRPRTLYAAANDQGALKSTDGGETWSLLERGLPPALWASFIALDPRRPQTLFLSSIDFPQGYFASNDGGATWKKSGRGIPGLRDLAVDPAAAVLYAVGLDGQIYKSTNGGSGWRQAVTGLEGARAADLEATRSGLLAGTSGRGVFASGDRAASWAASSQGLSALSPDLAIAAQSPPRLYAGDLGAGLFKSADRGGHWLRLDTDLDLDTFWFTGLVEVDQRDPLTVYAGFFRGFAKSTNGGRRWQARDMGCVQPLRLLADPGPGDTLYVSGGFVIGACGLQPGACFSFKITGVSASCLRDNLIGPAGVPVLAVDPHAPGHLFTARDLGNAAGLYRSSDAGGSWSLLAPDVLPLQLVFDPQQAGLVYGAFRGAVGRSEDGGATWEMHAAGLPAEVLVVALAVDPSDPSVLYAATEHRGVFRSADAGRAWSLLVPGSGELRLTGAVLDPEDPSILYLSTHGAGVLMVEQDVAP